MDLSDLRIFRAVVQEGGVTRAARRLHRVQSNITTRVRQLEQDLGVQLFIREGKRLHLTPAGNVLIGYAERLLTLSEEARTAVHDGRPRGVFHLGAMESTAAVRLPRPIAEYHRRHPEVTVELRTGNPTQLTSAILAGEIEAALLAGPVGAQFESVPVFTEEVVIVAPAGHPPINGRNGWPRAIIVFEHGCPHRRQLEACYAKRGLSPERVIELGSYHAMLGCVMVGMGAALLPRSVLDTFSDRARLSVHPLARGEDRLTTLLVWRKGADSPKIAALREILAGNRRSASKAAT